MQSPPCVIVLGMHRSGTSLLTGSLEAAGLHLGEVNHAAPFNQKGNKENEAIRDFHDDLLTRDGAAWNRPPKQQIRWQRSDEDRALRLVAPYIRNGHAWGFKDPRTLWVVEGWIRLLSAPRIIGVFRHPSLVARSLAARAGELSIGADAAQRLWHAYNSELLRLHRKHQFPLLHFNSTSDGALQRDFVTPLASFVRSLGLDGSVEGFFDPALVHQAERSPVATWRSQFLFARLTARSRKAAPYRCAGARAVRDGPA